MTGTRSKVTLNQTHGWSFNDMNENIEVMNLIYKIKILMLIMLLLPFIIRAENSLQTPYEQGNGNQTATYHEVIDFYQQLASRYKTITIEAVGMTDAGLPLHRVNYLPEALDDNNEKENLIILINNGIHPGEPDGIDATMMLFRDYASGKIRSPKNIEVVTIPVYNIGGALNRNATTRTNQNGPESYGFRGNARNYDLNRDFIKADSLNARAFMDIFHAVNPDVFIDNHVSNGADYQYVLTHLMTQHNKLGGQLGVYLKNTFQPKLEQSLSQKNWPITPYVNVFNRPPDAGFSQFFDSPRYSTGYTALFNTLGMMLETHMLKPYAERVKGSYVFLQTVIELADQDSVSIKGLRQKSLSVFQVGDQYPLQWQLSEDKFSMIDFLGYESQDISSEVTGLKRLKYDRDKPVKKKIRYQDTYLPTLSVIIPKAYLIPQGWHRVIDLLKRNQIQMQPLDNDTVIAVESYKIKSYSTNSTVYEGHYLHDSVELEKSIKDVQFKEGDFYIPTNQKGLRYILEVLEPQAMDSFFRWNFFDTILTQKEGFSPYVWEDKAQMLLLNDPVLKSKFDTKRQVDKAFSNNAFLQLKWLHQHSEHQETEFQQYPVYRLN